MPISSAPFAPRRLATAVALASLAVLLASCGGGDAVDAPRADSAEVDDTAPGLAERQALAAANPALSTDQAHYIVTLNAAALADGERQAARALSAATPLTPQARALQAVRSTTARLLAAETGVRVRQHFAHALPGFALSVPQADAADVIERLRQDPAVTRIEHDRLVSATAPASDPIIVTRSLDSSLWGLDRIDQLRLPLDTRYRNGLDGSGVTVYVVDTGISPHGEFGDRLLPDGFDGIGDGLGTRDCGGHGTHVAGTAAGSRTGIASAARVVPVRVLPCGGSGPSSTILRGLDWIAAHGQRPGVVNLSLGGPASTTMDDAIGRIVAAGFTVVVAAGNENTDACRVSPARAAAALTVAASDRADSRAWFSNYGRCVDLFAPGVQILSAGIAAPDATATMSGTSMASPHVAGTAALLLQERPKLTPAQVAQQLLSQTSPVVKNTAGAPTRLLYAGSARQLVFPTPWDVHVAALGATARASGRANWLASVTVTVHNEENQPLKGVRVQGQFANKAARLTCTTAANGTCTFGSTAVPNATPTLAFAVTTLSGDALTYRPADNVVTTTTATRP